MIVFINFLYGAGIPLLYATTLITLIFSYFIDKFLCIKPSLIHLLLTFHIKVLKMLKLPKTLDEKLSQTVRKCLSVILPLHLIFAIWTYGSPSIFGNYVISLP